MKVGAPSISRSCLIAWRAGLNPPQGIRNLFLIEFTLCHIPIRDARVRETVRESRHVMHCCRGDSRSFVSKWIHRVFSNFRGIATRSRDLELSKLKLWRIIGFFFFSLNKIIFILQFYHNFQNSPLPFDKFIIR